MRAVQEVQAAYTQLIQEITTTFEQLIQRLEDMEPESPGYPSHSSNYRQNYETVYPLSGSLSIFKGKKPVAVLFGDHSRAEVRTWKMVFQKILQDCNSDPEKHVVLMNLRGRISGRDRVLLSREPGHMRSPLKIAENLYVETHYDTETLLRILTTRILSAVPYNYSHISIAVRN